MKYEGIFDVAEYNELKEYKYRIDIFCSYKQNKFERHIFKTRREMMHYIAKKINYVFDDIYILELVTCKIYGISYEIKDMISWNDYE